MSFLGRIVRGYCQRKVLIFFALGLSCGVPLNLLGNTLSLWTAEQGVSLKEIGYFSLALIPYSLKFLWAPFIDRIALPFSDKMGKKKTWGIIFQLGLIFCIVQLAFIDPARQIQVLFAWCFFAAFFAASQDIVVDALRIDTLDGDELKEGSSLYQFGYRMGMLITGAGVIALSAQLPWSYCYVLSAFLLLAGFVSLLFTNEPKLDIVHKVSFRDLTVQPFSDFIQRHKLWALILIFIVLYKLSNAVLGRMAYPFYYEIGFSKNEIALVSGAIGPWITMFGVFIGGIVMVRWGFFKSLFYLGCFEVFTSFAFAGLASMGNNVAAFLAVIAFDNIVGGMGGAVLVGFLSSLCSRRYSGTQYALLTSLNMVPASIVASQSGVFVHMMGWVDFFVLTGFLMIPALFLLYFIGVKESKISDNG